MQSSRTVPSHISKTIAWLQFPMATTVVFCHSSLDLPSTSWLKYSLDLFETLSLPMMQLFFLFSGFLFFIRYNSFGVKEYITSIRHKSRTLFIPYILWCTIASVLTIIQSSSFDTIDTNLITDLYWCGHGTRFTVTPFGNVIPLISYPSCNWGSMVRTGSDYHVSALTVGMACR